MNRLSSRAVAVALCVSVLTAHAQEFGKHAVVCQEGNAANAGLEILRDGGNAVDAAVATAFALAVTHPEAGNLGGGGFLVSYQPTERRATTFEFRESAPLAANETMYLDERGKPAPGHRAGARAAGVPGTVRGLGLAHQSLGRLRWPQLIEPAIRLARDGFRVSNSLAISMNQQLARSNENDASSRQGPRVARLGDFPESVAAFRKPDGHAWVEGDVLRQPDLARTLDRIAARGPDEFYRGETAERITRYMREQHGLITSADLMMYEAKIRPAIRGRFRGFELIGAGPPSSGGVLIVEMLNILERFDLKADGPRHPRTIHRVTEAMRRGFFTRATELGDPDFSRIRADRLITREDADALAATIGDRATPSAKLAPFPIADSEGSNTTHLSVIDSEGNAVALTYTLEDAYGSKAVVSGCGFLLNNEMGDFNLVPGSTTTAGRIGTPPNLIAPGKRMLSSQSPTIVLEDGRVRLITGSPGGRTIPNTTLWVILNVCEFGLTPSDAVAAPRTHHAWFPDELTLEGTSWSADVTAALEALGHKIKHVKAQGNANSIVVDLKRGRIFGVPDRRRETARAAGD